MNKIKLILPVLSIFIATSVLTGCNTVQGVGKDISAGGQALQSASGKKSTSKTNTVSSNANNHVKSSQQVSTNYTATTNTTKTSNVAPTQTNSSYNY